MDPDIRNLDSHAKFCKNLLSFIISSKKSIYNIHDSQWSKLLNGLSLDINHLPEHKFGNKSVDTVNSLCSCALETESTGHFFFTLPKLCIIGTTLMNESSIINCGKVSFRLSALLEVILYGDKMLNDKSNQSVLNATINYIKYT